MSTNAAPGRLSPNLAQHGYALSGGSGYAELVSNVAAIPEARHVADTPERQLWRAVLQDGIVGALDIPRAKGQHRTARDRSEEIAQDKAWLFVDDWNHPVSYVNICAYLGIDPERIRDLVRRGIRPAPVVARRRDRTKRRTATIAGLAKRAGDQAP